MNPPPPPFQLPPPPPPPPPPQQQPPQLSHTPNPFFLLPTTPTTTTTTTTTTTVSPDLPTALSTLTSLLHVSNTALTSLPITPLTPTLVCCPFNPNHRLPPFSLFSHSLRCPSSPSPLSPSTSLHSPHTLHHPSFTATPTLLPTPTSSLSIPLDIHSPFASSFFYSDCPAVVSHPNKNPSPSLLTLPPDLLEICADFSDSNCDGSGKGVGFGFVGLLPSEVWGIRNEVEGWRDYPSSYSHLVLRTILSLNVSSLVNFPTWVVVNSVKYGVVIDCAMSDHILLLFRLCLKAIVDEAIGFGESLLSVEVKGDDDKGVRNRSFRCLVLGRVLMWLVSQLAVLYGEVNGKHFAISMLKQCVLDASFGNSIFSESTGLEKVDSGKNKEGVEGHSKNDRRSRENGPIGKHTISVSQVAAAVAALHERSMLEEKIRASRDSRSLTAYQRKMEHETISRMADEERKRRADYRPLIEHDVLIRQHSSNEDTNKVKTREEILAEERDYKRRRMSYRGKKLKRSTTEVMRDIIEEYMGEIKQASEVGCSTKGSENAEDLVSEPLPMQDNSENIYRATKDFDDSSEMSRMQQYSNRTFDSRYNMQPGVSKEFYFDGSKLRRKDSYHGHPESERSIRRPHHDREINIRSPDERRSRHNRGDHSRSPDRKRSRRSKDDYSRSPSKRRSRRDREDRSRSPDKRRSRRDRKGHSRSPDGRSSSYHAFGRSSQETKHEDLSGELFPRSSEGKYGGSNKQYGHQREDNSCDLELKNKQHTKSHRNVRSSAEFEDRYNSIVHDEFEDRYNPSDSHGS